MEVGVPVDHTLSHTPKPTLKQMAPSATGGSRSCVFLSFGWGKGLNHCTHTGFTHTRPLTHWNWTPCCSQWSWPPYPQLNLCSQSSGHSSSHVQSNKHREVLPLRVTAPHTDPQKTDALISDTPTRGSSPGDRRLYLHPGTRPWSTGSRTQTTPGVVVTTRCIFLSLFIPPALLSWGQLGANQLSMWSPLSRLQGRSGRRLWLVVLVVVVLVVVIGVVASVTVVMTRGQGEC